MVLGGSELSTAAGVSPVVMMRQAQSDVVVKMNVNALVKVS